MDFRVAAWHGTGEANEANGEQTDVSVPIELSGATMDQETEVQQGQRETGGRVEVAESAEKEERGEDARGRGPKEAC